MVKLRQFPYPTYRELFYEWLLNGSIRLSKIRDQTLFQIMHKTEVRTPQNSKF